MSGASNFIASNGNPGSALVLNDAPGPVPSASQNISGLTIGTNYQIDLDALTFYNCCNSATVPGAGVSIDGHQFDFLVVNNQPYTHYTFNFTYSGVNSLLVLSSQRNGTDSDAEFDNVSITAVPNGNVPEPGTLTLVSLALGLVAMRSRRV